MTMIVDINERDGMFYATSEDMPGFLLVNRDRSALHNDILPTMKKLVAIKARHTKAKKVASKIVERVELAVSA